MNAYRIISRVLAVTVVVFVGRVNGNDYSQKFATQLNKNRFTTIAALLESHACKKDEHAKKAIIDTFGHALDSLNGSKGLDSKQLDLQAEGIHLAANYGIRKGTAYLHHHGISLDSVAKKADVLPEGMVRDVVNPVVKTAAETATHPEALMFIAGLVISMILKS